MGPEIRLKVSESSHEANSTLAFYAVDTTDFYEVRGINCRQFFPKEISFVRKVM